MRYTLGRVRFLTRIGCQKAVKTFRHAYISFVRKMIVPNVSWCAERKPFRHKSGGQLSWFADIPLSG